MPNTIGWKQAKKRKMRELNNRCEECTCKYNPPKLVLHHIRNRSQGGRDTYQNARLRCKKCEADYHAKYPNGNKPN